MGGGFYVGDKVYENFREPVEPVLVKEFNYTGGIQNVTLQAGKYLLECWGTSSSSSYASYSYIKTYVTEEIILYVVIGGMFATTATSNGAIGGYNGGGNGGNGGNGSIGGQGGCGATHISTISGLLNNSSVRNNIYVVAGGGNSGGGITGESVGMSGASYGGQGGNQTSGGAGGGINMVSFAGAKGGAGVGGKGGNGINGRGGHGGNGGWYGGGGSSAQTTNTGPAQSGGGSGYINTSKGIGATFRSDEIGYVSKPTTDAHGYARIYKI